MTELTSLDWYDHPKGRVAIVESPQTFTFGACPFIGQTVRIDGEDYVIRGVEAHAIVTICAGSKIGLLVEKLS